MDCNNNTVDDDVLVKSENYSLLVDNSLFKSAIHYNDFTILNCDGCLMQTIEIFTNKRNHIEIIHILKRLFQNDDSIIDFSFYINILRRDVKFRVDMNNNNGGYFSNSMHDNWSKINNFKHGDILNNSLYFTIVIHNDVFSKMHFGDFFFFLLKSRFFKKLEILTNRLTRFVDKIIKVLAENDLQVKHFSLRSIKGVLYSDYLDFFYSLLFCQNLTQKVENVDFSYFILNKSKFIFDFNTLQIIKPEEKIFAAMFSIKSDSHITSYAIKKLLTLPIFFNVVQNFNFINNNIAFDELKKQYQMLHVSKSDDLIRSLRMKEALQNRGIFSLCAIQATTFTIYGFTQKELKDNISLFNNTCQECGLLINRLDLRLEEGFWSQLPGNSVFVNYKNIYFNNYGCFLYAINESNNSIDINDFNYGKLLSIDQNDEYFIIKMINEESKINFILGDYCNIILNFLLSFIAIDEVRIVLIDFDQKSRLLFNALGYKYFRITKNNQTRNRRVGLNILSLCGTAVGNSYLVKLLLLMIRKQNSQALVEKDQIKHLQEILQDIVNKITRDDNIYRLSDCKKLFQEKNIELDQWFDEGEWSGIFDNDFTLEFEHDSIAFDFSEINDVEIQGIICDFLAYYLQKDQMEQKTFFVINNFLSLHESSNLFGERMTETIIILEKLGIFPILLENSYSKLLHYKEDVLLDLIDNFFFTQGDHLKEVMSILDIDINILSNFKSMNSFNNKIIFATDNKAHTLKLNLSHMNEYLFLSSNDQHLINQVKKLKKEYNADMKKWIERLYEITSL